MRAGVGSATTIGFSMCTALIHTYSGLRSFGYKNKAAKSNLKHKRMKIPQKLRHSTFRHWKIKLAFLLVGQPQPYFSAHMRYMQRSTPAASSAPPSWPHQPAILVGSPASFACTDPSCTIAVVVSLRLPPLGTALHALYLRSPHAAILHRVDRITRQNRWETTP